MTESNYPLPFRTVTESGAVKGASTVAYAFCLPAAEEAAFSEAAAFLTELKEAFLGFLKRESEKEQEGVRFGGLSLQAEENAVTLLAAYCPFGQRDYRPVARLIFNPSGRLVAIRLSKKRRK